MKKNKLLSLLITFSLILSILMPALSVSAADEELSLAEQIQAFDGKVDVAEPAPEVLAEFNALINAYAALSAEEKEDFDLFALGKLLQLITNHQTKVKKALEPSATTYVQYEYAHAKALEQLSPPAYVEQAGELRIALEDKTTTAAQKMAAFADSNRNARILAGAYWPSYKAFYYRADQYPTKAIELLATAYSAEGSASTPNPDEKPARLTKPQAKNYAEGESDPQYIADFAAWLEGEKAYYIWYAGDYNYKIAFEDAALVEIAEYAPEYAAFVNLVFKMRNAKALFDQGGDAKDLAAEVLDDYEALAELDKFFIEKYTKNVYYAAVDKAVSWTYEYKKPAALLTACQDIVNSELLDEFINYIEAMSPPYSREDIEAAKAERAKVPASLVSNIPTDILAKYNSILASIGPEIPSDEKLDLSNKPKTKVKYPSSKGKAGVKDIYETLGTLINDILNLDLATMLGEGLYTNDMVGTIASAIYPLLGNESSLIAQGPNDLATKLDEEKFAGAKAKLEAAVSEYNPTTGNPIKNLDDWANVKFESGDWGFEDGDREGFLDAASATFRALSLLTMVIKFENNKSTTNGTYTYHAYEDLIPVLEALDLRGVYSSDDYTTYIAEESDSFKKMDRRIRPILEPVANLLDDIAADPLNGLLDLLPKFAMLLNTGILNNQIGKVISEMSMVSIDPPDLTTTGLFGMLAPALSEIEIKAAETDEDGNITKPAAVLKLNLSEAKFVKLIDDLEGCGTYSMHDSIRRTSIYHAGIDSDKADTFIVLYNWLHSEIAEQDNMTSLIKAISAMGLGAFETMAIQILLMAFQNIPGMTSLNLLTLLMPLAKFVLKFAKVFEKLGTIG